MVGFTGDPYAGCIDINECSIADLNTCAGGMNPGGVSRDIITDSYDYDRIYIGPVDSDGYSLVYLKDYYH